MSIFLTNKINKYMINIITEYLLPSYQQIENDNQYIHELIIVKTFHIKAKIDDPFYDRIYHNTMGKRWTMVKMYYKKN